MHDDPAAAARRAGCGERFEKSSTESLTRHLHEAQRRHLGHLVARAIARQGLRESTQHQVAVGFEHHVDEVDDDHAADIAQTHLPHDLFGRLEVVAGHRLFEVAPGAGELARIDVDDGHRLGVLDDQRAARRQPHLAVECLGELLVDAVHDEGVGCVGARTLEALHPIHEVGRDRTDVSLDEVPRLVAFDDELLEVLVEQVADHADQQVRLLVERARRHRSLVGLAERLVDRLPLLLESLDVGSEVVGADTLRRGADDDAGIVGDELGEDLLEPLALDVGKLAADAGRRSTRHVDQVATSQRDLRGQASTLVTDRVLADLHEHRITRFEGLFDLARPAVESGSVPVDLTRVENAVATATDVDERGLHAGQHVLHAPDVDVADHRRRRLRGDEVLDEHTIFEHGDLRVVLDGSDVIMLVGLRESNVGAALTHDHHPVDGLAAREELRLTQNRWSTTPRVPTVATSLALGLEARRPRNPLHLVAGTLAARLPLVDDGVRRIVGRR